MRERERDKNRVCGSVGLILRDHTCVLLRLCTCSCVCTQAPLLPVKGSLTGTQRQQEQCEERRKTGEKKSREGDSAGDAV